MSDNFDFGLGDIAQDNDSGRTLARGAAAFLVVLFLALSCLATFMFFSTYAPGLGDWAGPVAAPIAAGVIGLLCLDVACILWGYIRTKAATSAAQMAIALVISVIDLLLGLLASGLYIILSTAFETGVRDASGALTRFGALVNYVGIGVITLALVGNFASVFAWLLMGADAKAAQLMTELRAIVAAGLHRVNKARAVRVVNRTIAEIERQLPAAADNVAAQKSAEYVAAKLERGYIPAHNLPQSYAAEQPADMDLEDLVSYLVEERLHEQKGGRGAAPDLYEVAKANNFTPEEAAAAIVGMRHNYNDGQAADLNALYDKTHGDNGANPTQRPAGR